MPYPVVFPEDDQAVLYDHRLISEGSGDELSIVVDLHLIGDAVAVHYKGWESDRIAKQMEVFSNL